MSMQLLFQKTGNMLFLETVNAVFGGRSAMSRGDMQQAARPRGGFPFAQKHDQISERNSDDV